jgi:hypothetical protein
MRRAAQPIDVSTHASARTLYLWLALLAPTFWGLVLFRPQYCSSLGRDVPRGAAPAQAVRCPQTTTRGACVDGCEYDRLATGTVEGPSAAGRNAVALSAMASSDLDVASKEPHLWRVRSGWDVAVTEGVSGIWMLTPAKFSMHFNDFTTPAVPRDIGTYKDYRRLTIEFVKARNVRIRQWAVEHSPADVDDSQDVIGSILDYFAAAPATLTVVTLDTRRCVRGSVRARARRRCGGAPCRPRRAGPERFSQRCA